MLIGSSRPKHAQNVINYDYTCHVTPWHSQVVRNLVHTDLYGCTVRRHRRRIAMTRQPVWVCHDMTHLTCTVLKINYDLTYNYNYPVRSRRTRWPGFNSWILWMFDAYHLQFCSSKYCWLATVFDSPHGRMTKNILHGCPHNVPACKIKMRSTVWINTH